jgi:hypothetical protein
MSMSQEEIEALMNESTEVSTEVSEDDTSVVEKGSSQEDSMSTDDIESLIENVDEISDIQEDNLDEVLSEIDGISEDKSSETEEENVEAIMSNQIDKGVYPLPVEREHKVVNQLSEVAEDSEEKASQIFDVLSFILDQNNDIEQHSKHIDEFIVKQTALLEALSSKFPNVTAISENLELAKTVSSVPSDISQKLTTENDKVFVAMDLMQYHDINRQKIERVMSVIRKLSTYLNGIFEDDSTKPEVQIAKHISGDSSSVVDNDDLEALIAEFND